MNLDAFGTLNRMKTINTCSKIVPYEGAISTEREILKPEFKMESSFNAERFPENEKQLEIQNKSNDGNEEKDDNENSFLDDVINAVSEDIPYNHMCQLQPGKTYDLNNEDLRGKISGHIIVCGFHHNLTHFVSSIRECNNIPICFLFEDDTPPFLSKLYAKYKHIFHFQGAPDNLVNLTNAAVASSFHVIILASINNPQETLHTFSDDKAIMTSRLILGFFDDIQITLELSQYKSLEFMNYIPIESQRELVSYAYWPNYMMGKVFVSEILNVISSKVYQDPSFMHLVKSCAKTNNTINDHIQKLGITECNNLYSFRVPRKYIDKRTSFETVFNDLLKLEYPLIAIGIFGGQQLITSKADIMQWNEFVNFGNIDIPVLYINPNPEVRINKNDYILCIGYIPYKNTINNCTSHLDERNDNIQALSIQQQNFYNLTNELNKRLGDNLYSIKEDHKE